MSGRRAKSFTLSLDGFVSSCAVFGVLPRKATKVSEERIGNRIGDFAMFCLFVGAASRLVYVPEQHKFCFIL